MKNFENKQTDLANISENTVLEMINDTSQLIAEHNTNQLSSAAVAAQNSNALANKVEFWSWMDRNFQNAGIFHSPDSMQEYIAQGIGKEDWFRTQLQGKGYEWDWMTTQRNNPLNLLKTYDAGDVSNRAASDITERHILTGKTKEYQMKAYTSKTNPALKNTPKDMTVVTNAEKTSVVNKNGYPTEEFQNAKQIKKATAGRLDQAKSGKAYPTYNIQNVAGTMAQAGLIGCAIGVGVETITSYSSWKSGHLTNEEYLKEILKAGGDAGITSGITAGIMVPVSAIITAAGVSNIFTIPVAFAISALVNKIVAPCFGRGDYRKILNKAKYYQNLDIAYHDLTASMQHTAEQYYDFLCYVNQQNAVHNELKQYSRTLDQSLSELYDSI